MYPVSKPAHPEPERPNEPSVATDKSPYFPYEHPATEPVAMETPSPVPQPFPGSYHDGVTLEGMDDMLEVSDVGADPVKTPLVIESLPSPAPTAPSGPDHDAGVILEGMDDMIWESDRTAGSSAERFVATPEPANHALPALREIKQQIEQFTEGRFERTSQLDLVRALIRSPETASYAFFLTFLRATHTIMFSFAAVLCASSCPAPPSLLPTLHLPSGF